MLEQEPKPKAKASAVTRRRGPPRVLIARGNGKAFYVNATCDAVRMVLAECKGRHRALETAFAAENAELKEHAHARQDPPFPCMNQKHLQRAATCHDGAYATRGAVHAIFQR